MQRYCFIATATLLMWGTVTVAGAETLNWNVRSKFGISSQGIRQAIDEAKAHFGNAPNDVIVLELDEGTFYLEDQGDSKGTIDLSQIKPGPNGRLIFRGKGMDKTILVFSDNKHALYGRDVYRVTMTGLHMTRKDYTVSQGLVVETAPGKVVLEIQEGFPTPAMIFNPRSDQGRFLRRYTNSKTDPHLVQEDNDQIPWTRAVHLEGRRWEIELKRKSQVANYAKDALIGIKSKHGGTTEFGGQAYWFMGGSDFSFESVKWTQKTRGVFRGGFQEVKFLNCVTDRPPPINGQMPCLAAPGGGPQIGQPDDLPTSGNVVKNCRFIASGDDAVAFFNASGIISDCYIRDAFCRGILAANSPNAELSNNTVIRCPIQQTEDYRLPENQNRSPKNR
ncbi:right-handed parallel beta-helix repeat-containing protein [Aporhodopirellula aestuarii]|uniref:Right-handed parallel beta-helix repeat-containing protein n=1 Tax=Aporhodopirellula aestuarii TaxID=2950107 RepID=A0ABT0UF90_9BACT|nr:right-handed parallel beta-helix repeat-containing protein [Aporhodopirellula aestuarii]MCM2375264.1 right-handed parallel beta-helix repeat-containing protein [Aporhodopirellula aestuarii]